MQEGETHTTWIIPTQTIALSVTSNQYIPHKKSINASPPQPLVSTSKLVAALIAVAKPIGIVPTKSDCCGCSSMSLNTPGKRA